MNALAFIDINVGERLIVRRVKGRDIDLQLLRRVGEDGATIEFEIGLPITSLRDLSLMLDANVQGSVPLAGRFQLVVLPRGPRVTLAVFRVDGHIHRALRLNKLCRRQLVTAIEHARCAVSDPTLLEEIGEALT